MTIELVVNPFLINLIKFIGIDANLEEKLEQFDGTFDRNEIVDI
jgi:hypothetical protein